VRAAPAPNASPPWRRSGAPTNRESHHARSRETRAARSSWRNVSTTLIHRGSTFRLASVTPAGGHWVDGELAAPRSLRTGRRTAVGGFPPVRFRPATSEADVPPMAWVGRYRNGWSLSKRVGKLPFTLPASYDRCRSIPDLPGPERDRRRWQGLWRAEQQVWDQSPKSCGPSAVHQRTRTLSEAIPDDRWSSRRLRLELWVRPGLFQLRRYQNLPSSSSIA
jgi:hypothetical protein